MDKESVGKELNQVARLLFNAASSKFYISVMLEIFAGIFSATLGILPLTEDVKLFGAIAGTLIITLAYGLRLLFEDQYETAETMRRQAVLTEALGWPISRVQATEWLQKAGKQIRIKVQNDPLPKNYYSTKKTLGPERLLEMTLEGLFYTRHLYLNLTKIIWGLEVGSLATTIVVMSFALSTNVPNSIDLLVAKYVYTIIPIIITINLFGWGARLTRITTSLKEIEDDLERLSKQSSVDLEQVIRLVFEYNCQVVGGFPIHNSLYIHWKSEISELWNKRQRI